LPYQMIAERYNEKAQSRTGSLFIAVAKARLWASEGWEVVVVDGAGKSFTPAEFDDLCCFDPRKSRHASTQIADDLLGDSQELHSQDSHAAGEERIGPPLLADAGAGTVPTDEADIVAEGQQLVGDGLDQGGVTATGDVAAADRAIEEHVANMGETDLLVEENDAAR
jgi:hypothetical protein